jgi:uncharacterized RDD family membrane protein YckC
MFGIGKKKDQAQAAPADVSVAPAAAASAVDMQPAGFWLRVVAFIVDYAVLLILLAGMMMGAISVGGEELAAPAYGLWVLVTFLYWPVLESTAWRGTVGKKLLGLVVGDIDGGGLGFLRSLLRNLAKIISSIPLGIGFLMAAFTTRKQALHDLITKAVVMRRGPGSVARAIGVLALGVVLLIAGGYLTMDYMSGTVMKEMEGIMAGGVAEPPARPTPRPVAVAKPAAPAPAAPPAAAPKPAPVPATSVASAPPAQAQATASKPAAAPLQVAQAPAPAKPAPSPATAAKPVATPAPKPEPIKVAEAPKPEPMEAKPAPAPATSAAPRAPAELMVPLAGLAIPAQPGPRFNDVMTAVLYRDRETVSQLVALGRWVDKPDSKGLTPLMVAAGSGDAEMVRLLLQSGADPERLAPGGATAFDFALEHGDAPTMQLLQRKAPVR